MGNKLYKPKNKRKKENLKMIDRLEISGVTIAAIALLGWSGYSIANTFIPQPETPVYEVNVDSVSDYMDNLDSEVEEAEATPTPTTTPAPTSTPVPTKEPTKTPAPTKMPKKKVKKEVIYSKLDGVVSNVGDPLKGASDGDSFMTVKSEDGYYVKGTVSELLLDQVKEGAILSCSGTS